MINAQEKWQKILEKELKLEMKKAPSIVSSHNIDHVRRVWKNIKLISKEKNVDFEVLIAAAFLHDIGRHYPEGSREHGPISAPLAKEVLKRINFPKEKIDNAILSITYHDETFPNEKRSTIESKILYDADKLDVFGAIGVSRYLIFNAQIGKNLKETINYALENLPLRFERIELDSTKKIGKEKYEYTLNYFKKLKEEIK